MKLKLLFLVLIICSCTHNKKNDSSSISETRASISSKDNIAQVFSLDRSSLSEVSFQKEAIIPNSDSIFIEYISFIEVDNFGKVFAAESTPRSKSIYVFNDKGAFLRKIGKEGRGPGEFLMISDMKAKNGKLYVLDHKSYRISIYSLQGLSLLKTVSISYQDSSLEKGYILGDSFFILSENLFLVNFKDPRSLNGDGSNYSGYYHVNDSGEIASKEVLSLKQPRYFVSDKEPGPGYVLPFTAPFSRSSLISVSDQGNIYTVWTDRFLVKKYNRDGEYLNTYKYPFDKVELSSSEAISLIIGDKRKEIAKEGTLPDTWPAIHDMAVDNKSRLWVFIITDNDSSYGGWVLNKKGEPLKSFSWPSVRSNRHLTKLGRMVINNRFFYKVEKKGSTGIQQIVKYKFITD